MTNGTPTATFRDPAGSLSLEGDFAVRTIHPEARDQVMEFVTSPFCNQLQQRGDMIAITINDTPAGLQLVHPRVPVPTYPWEWTPSQWLAAAQLTLSLCAEALDEGWVLKDATPLNILFVGSRPVLVDVLSFERWDPAPKKYPSHIWLAYGQYVRTFLLPLLMNRLLSWPLELSLFKRDGYEPVELYKALSWRQRLSSEAFWPVTLAARLDRKSEQKPAGKTPPQHKSPELALHLLKRTLANLRRQTLRAMPEYAGSEWSNYTATLTHYTAQESAQKLDWVRHVLEELKPARVLDIGANTGVFSALAAEQGAQVVALERDAAAAESLYRMTCNSKLSIQTIHADLARPTPAAGWENHETSSLLHRLEAKSDLVLMLAVIHHLILMEQIPISAILELAYKLTSQTLVLEWVPVSDPMYQSLMRGRDALYGSLGEADLLTACAGRFRTLRRQPLENGRILFLFAKES
ncbi:MAG TPA: class I SAM-dependent methyltransferase [Acidobacteriaceae bacterium]|nr:class I SAM-dependent methyltransferase [Acidobacteriaceae bacterium]